MDQRTPRSREKHVTSGGSGVHKRGSGLGTGPVGTGERRPTGGSSSGRQGGGAGGSGRRGGQRSGGQKSPLTLIIALIVCLLGGGGGAAAFLGGGSDDAGTAVESGTTAGGSTGSSTSGSTSGSSYGTSGSGYGGSLSTLFGSSTTSADTIASNVGKLNTEVAEGSRDKRTVIKGDGSDTTTIMVYMCGTDLESKYGMGTNDIKEMMAASFDDHINLILYTGGCSAWKNNTVSSTTNQIYQIRNGKLQVLEKDLGETAMTSPDNLASFIEYCTENYPANRNDLILWDHGGGSLTGYGYDEKFKNSGSMTLSGIRSALDQAGTTFDFIGFDACLMATVENAEMLGDYADYLIASEETEPGVGWYYTDWLTSYGEDPSMSTLEIGKNIIDSFVQVCSTQCKGQQTTLSIVDLAELTNTVPDKISAFSTEICQKIKDSDYQSIATARGNTREFAQSSKIDQIDLVDLTQKIGTDTASELADALLSAVKYNRTSTNMTHAYGISAYFPYRRLSNVDSAVKIYESIGMDEEYTRAIQDYASLGTAGQCAASASGSGNVMNSLLGSALGGTSSSDAISEILGAVLSSGVTGISGLDSSSLNFLSGRSLSTDEMAAYVSDHQFDGSALTWNSDGDTPIISLSEDQWALVNDVEMNMFYDDGEGYIDLGRDNLFTINDESQLEGETDHTWLAINGQNVAYYHLTTQEDGDNYTITGYVPAMLDGERVQLMITFDQDEPYGYIAGARTDYHDGETETQAKELTEVSVGSELEFLCDYYTYDGEYQDTYYLGEPMTVTDDMEISNVDVGDGDVLVTYCFTDIYGAEYWSEVMPD